MSKKGPDDRRGPKGPTNEPLINAMLDYVRGLPRHEVDLLAWGLSVLLADMANNEIESTRIDPDMLGKLTEQVSKITYNMREAMLRKEAELNDPTRN